MCLGEFNLAIIHYSPKLFRIIGPMRMEWIYNFNFFSIHPEPSFYRTGNLYSLFWVLKLINVDKSTLICFILFSQIIQKLLLMKNMEREIKIHLKYWNIVFWTYVCLYSNLYLRMKINIKIYHRRPNINITVKFALKYFYGRGNKFLIYLITIQGLFWESGIISASEKNDAIDVCFACLELLPSGSWVKERWYLCCW